MENDLYYINCSVSRKAQAPFMYIWMGYKQEAARLFTFAILSISVITNYEHLLRLTCANWIVRSPIRDEFPHHMPNSSRMTMY